MTSGPERAGIPASDPIAAFGASLGLPAPSTHSVRALTTAERVALQAQRAPAAAPAAPAKGAAETQGVAVSPAAGSQTAGGITFNVAPASLPVPAKAPTHRVRNSILACVATAGIGGGYGLYAHDHQLPPFHESHSKPAAVSSQLHTAPHVTPTTSEHVIQAPSSDPSSPTELPSSTVPANTSSAPATLPPGGVLPIFQPQAIPATVMVNGQVHDLRIPIIEHYTIPGDKSGTVYTLDSSFSIQVSDGSYAITGQAPVTGDVTKDALTYNEGKSNGTGLSVADFSTLTPDGKPSTFTTTMSIDGSKIGVNVPKLSGNSATMGAELSTAFAADFTPKLRLSSLAALALYHQVVGNQSGTTTQEKTGQTMAFVQDAKAAIARLAQSRFTAKFAQIYLHYIQPAVVQQQAGQQIPTDYTKRDTFSFKKIPDMTSQFPVAPADKAYTVDIVHVPVTATTITAVSADGKVK